jgi:DNA replication protein DnaC
MGQIQESEIVRLSRRMKWSVVEHYKKHIKLENCFEDNLLALLRLESDLRERESVKRRIKQAGFPIIKTLDTFEFNPAKLPYLQQEQVIELSLCDFIKARTNVCAIGNSGTGNYRKCFFIERNRLVCA